MFTTMTMNGAEHSENCNKVRDQMAAASGLLAIQLGSGLSRSNDKDVDEIAA